MAYGSKTFTPAQIKMLIYAKEFLAKHFAFKKVDHIFWGALKPVIILTDNKTLTRIFQTKLFLLRCGMLVTMSTNSIWLKSHILKTQIRAAGYLSRLEADPEDRFIMKIREDVQMKPHHLNPATITSQTVSTNLIRQQLDIQIRLRKTKQIIFAQSKDSVLQQMKAKTPS